MASMFSKIAAANAAGGGGNSIRDGEYTFLVESVTYDKKFAGECFIAELRVMSATANGELGENGKPIEPNKVGSTASLVCNLTKHESAASNAKAFALGVLAAIGYVEEQITEERMLEVCSPQNPLRGMAVGCRTYRTVNKGRVNPANQGKILTLPKWVPIPQTSEDIVAQRKWLDTNAGPAAAAPAVAPTPAASPAPAPAPVAPPLAAPVAPPLAAPAPTVGGLLGGGILSGPR